MGRPAIESSLALGCGRMHCLAAFSIAVVTFALPAQAEQRVLWEREGMRHLRRAVAVTAAECRLANLRTMADRFLEQARPYQFASLRIVSDEQLVELGKVLPTHATYRMAKETAVELNKRNFCYAEALVIGADAVLRVRETDGTRTVTVLKGADPMALKLPSGSGRIVWLEYWGADELGNSGRVPLENLAVFIVARRPTI